MLLNIQSIRNKVDELKLFIESVQNPDFILLTEHWLKENEPLFLDDYDLLASYCRTKHVHGGTMILIHTRMLRAYNFVSVDRLNYLIVEKEFEFSMVCCSSLNFYIICIYRSPAGDYDSFIYRLEVLLTQLPLHATIILTGDLNVNFLDTSSRNTHSLLALLYSFNLSMHVESPTRISSSSSTLLDYVCTNCDKNSVDCGTVGAGLSDHEAVVCKFSFNFGTGRSAKQYKRLFTRKNYEKFALACQDVDWRKVLVTNTPLGEFNSLLRDIFVESFPLRATRSKHKKPWFSKGLKVSSRNMRCLHYIRKFALDNDRFLIYFNTYRRIFRRTIKNAKQIYFRDRFGNSRNRQRDAWKVVNELRGKKSTKSVDSNLDCNKINEFYSSIAVNLNSYLTPDCDYRTFLNTVNVSESFYLVPTNIYEIKEVLNDIQNKNASGWDELSVRIFLHLPDRALVVLAEGINCSFESGIFPSCLKIATVIPLYKGGDSDSPANFRPISLLPTLAKIVEKLVKRRLQSFFNRHNLLCTEQYGFRESRGTDDAVFAFLENLYLGINDGEVAAAVFCDLSKAFDCVNHGILLWKLEKYGIRGTSLDWFRSYLTARFQKVNFNRKSSEQIEIQYGVPQGSVLGPLLFLVYINDLAGINIKGKFTLYADDSTILWVGKNAIELQNYINEDLTKVKEWTDANFLSLNVSKTNIVTFKCYLGDVKLGNQAVNRVSVNKFLGLYIDSKLKFEMHITNLTKKLASNCYAIRIIANDLDLETVRSAYFSLIESHLRFGICFWGSCSQYLFNMLFVLQKRAVKYMFKAKFRDSSRPLFISHKLLTLPSLFLLESSCLVYKKFQREIGSLSQYNTRQSYIAYLPIPTSSQTKNSVIYRSKKIFNQLPLRIRKINSYKKFRREVKALLGLKAYYSVSEFFNDSLN